MVDNKASRNIMNHNVNHEPSSTIGKYVQSTRKHWLYPSHVSPYYKWLTIHQRLTHHMLHHMINIYQPLTMINPYHVPWLCSATVDRQEHVDNGSRHRAAMRGAATCATSRWRTPNGSCSVGRKTQFSATVVSQADANTERCNDWLLWLNTVKYG